MFSILCLTDILGPDFHLVSIRLIPFTWLMNASSGLAGCAGLFIGRLVAKLLNHSSSKQKSNLQVLNTYEIQVWGPDSATGSYLVP